MDQDNEYRAQDPALYFEKRHASFRDQGMTKNQKLRQKSYNYIDQHKRTHNKPLFTQLIATQIKYLNFY